MKFRTLVIAAMSSLFAVSLAVADTAPVGADDASGMGMGDLAMNDTGNNPGMNLAENNNNSNVGSVVNVGNGTANTNADANGIPETNDLAMNNTSSGMGASSNANANDDMNADMNADTATGDDDY